MTDLTLTDADDLPEVADLDADMRMLLFAPSGPLSTTPLDGVASWLAERLDIDSGSGRPIDLGDAGVDVTGATAGHKAAIEALALGARTEFVDQIGRPLTGVGIVLVDQPLFLAQTNLDLSLLRFQAAAGFAGTMVTVGRSAGGVNTRLSLANRQDLSAWAGNSAAGILPGATLFNLDGDVAPGGRYVFEGGYAERGLLITGNVEKKKVLARLAYVDLAVEVLQTVSGSPDSLEVELDCSEFTSLSRSAYGPNGADTSVVWSGRAEGHVAKADDRDVNVDENGKCTTFDLQCRTYNGQGTGSFYRIEQEANDYADTIIFGGLNRHIRFYGRALNIKSARRLSGSFRLRESFNGRAWNGVKAEGATVPVEAVFIGRVIDAGDFHLDLTAIENVAAVKYGDDTYFPIGCDFGRSHISCGAFKPFNEEYPRAFVAADFYRAVDCSFPFSQLHGQLVIRAGIQNCTIRVPATWAKLGYGATIAADALFTLVVEGAIDFAQARAVPWLSQISGDQVVVFETVTDKGGLPVVYRGGRWEAGGVGRVSKLALGAAESDINRDFKRTGLMVGCSEDLAGAGADVGKAFVAQTDGRWREAGSGALVTVAEMAATTAFVARLGSAPPTAWRRIYDRFLYELSDIDALGAVIGAWLWGMESEAASLKAVAPAAVSGTWYDATKSGAPLWSQGEGFAMNPTTADQLALGYDMTVAAEGATQSNLLIVVGAERDNPAWSGSDNLFDIEAANGKAKLRDRDNAEQFSIGTTTTTAFPAGTARMPDVVMAGRVSSTHQFGLDRGRLAVQGVVASTGGGATGQPDAMSVVGSRVASCAGLFRADHFFTTSGGVAVPIGDRPQVLYRAFSQYMASVRAL